MCAARTDAAFKRNAAASSSFSHARVSECFAARSRITYPVRCYQPQRHAHPSATTNEQQAKKALVALHPLARDLRCAAMGALHAALDSY